MDCPVQLASLHVNLRAAQPRPAKSAATQSIASASHSATAASAKTAIPATASAVSSASATQSSTSKFVLGLHRSIRPHS